MSSATQNHNEKPKPIEDYLKKADILLDKRFLHFAFNCLGRNAEVQLENGKKAQGTFYTTNLDLGGIVLKNFSEGDAKENPSSTKVLYRPDFVYLLVPNVEEPPLLNAKKDVFKTDAEISKKKTVGQRKLVKWSGDEVSGGETLGVSLEEMADQKGKWNQFELNQKKFGLTSDFEEGMYTTSLDMKNVSSALLEKAARIEAEILGGASDFDNRHIREERGLQALKEENENEEEAYSSVIRTDSKPGDKKDEKRVFGFTNSKRKNDPPASTPTTTTTATSQLAPENKKETKETAETPKVSLPIPTDDTRAKANDIERTPQGGDSDHKLNRQMSNISDDASASNKHKARLSLKANSFEATFEGKPKEEAKAKEEPKPKEEEKPKPPVTKQASIDVEPEKKFNLNDYNSTAITKFKLKLNEKEIKKSSSTFFEIAISNWQKKPAIPDPAAVNPSWKISKAATLSVAPVSTVKTPAASTTATSKPFKPNNAPYQGGLPNYSRPPDNTGMMFPTPFPTPGFVPGAPMGFMPYGMPQQKFQPGVFPYGGQGGFQPQFPSFVDPNQPSFNMNYQHNTGNNPNNPNNRQGSMKNFNKNKS